ncbi:uncharacterized protein Z518_08239 [Rhinocladiella mackenziei CBS 650.93]|uniref:Rhinocladiella mackenziei CBS 650.93 unplaced genomic scaffold supercont1.6, whole genome shotgun sequence n=1 Tax=Rhinocladiella mackenziei CBS 650.93 TaxID=1442369 RepID=A0A0D2I8Y3_9EURO|nr:uncharacterized protein Z518_08239 [Rhinocladiella mackenziei CBS 650.93]KIX02299.1 hypothetical protein Z518_08239 [Rhinocladiella mackenziei CBS 650.93]
MGAGFICREFTAHRHYEDELASAIQGLFYSATPTFTLPLYLTFLRMLTARPTLILIPPSPIFIVVSCFNTAIITCLAQGAATYFNPRASENAISSGLALIKASLFLQLFLNGAFIYILTLVQKRQTARNLSHYQRDRAIAALTLLTMMGMILVCNIFRTVQIFVSPTSSLWTAEVFFWVFDACMLLSFTVVFHVMHPGKFLSVNSGGCNGERRDNEASSNTPLRRI